MRALRLAVLLPVLLAACTGVRPSTTSPQEAPAVQIVDPGQIYSTYDLRRDESARNEVKSQGVSDAGWEEIIELAQEARWPAGMQDLTSRASNRDVIRRLRTFRVASFDDKVILLVPADQGAAVPANFQGRKYYLVISESGVTLADAG